MISYKFKEKPILTNSRVTKYRSEQWRLVFGVFYVALIRGAIDHAGVYYPTLIQYRAGLTWRFWRPFGHEVRLGGLQHTFQLLFFYVVWSG